MTLTNTYSLNVDIKKRMTSIVPTFSQGDSAVLKFRVYDNGKLMDMSDYTHSEVMFRQPSGRTLTGDADLVNGEIVYTFTGLEMAEIGKLETILSVSSGSSTVSIQPFYCFIYDSMKSNNLEYIGILQELIKEVQGLELGVGGLLTDFNSFDYSPSTTYDFPNLITYNGSTYIALKAVTGITPIDDKINYRVVAKRGDDSEEISNHKNNTSPQKHINVVSSIPNDISNMGILVKVDGSQADVPSMITVDELNKSINQKVQAANLAYKESYATLSALQNAYPTGNQYNHVVLSDGMIYTWANNAWANTQIQANGTGIANNTISKEKLTHDVTAGIAGIVDLEDYLYAITDKDGRLSELALSLEGRVPSNILQAWKDRMDLNNVLTEDGALSTEAITKLKNELNVLSTELEIDSEINTDILWGITDKDGRLSEFVLSLEGKIPIAILQAWKERMGLNNVLTVDGEEAITNLRIALNVLSTELEIDSEINTDILWGITDKDGRLSEFTLNSEGQIPSWVLNAWKERMGVTSSSQNSGEIVAWGDSLTQWGGYGNSYIAEVGRLSGRTVHNNGVGGEPSNTIAARQGGLVMMVNNITIPSSASNKVLIATDSNPLKDNMGGDCRPLRQGDGGISPCYINGIKGSLSSVQSNASSNDYELYFQRETNGDAVVINRPTPIITDGAMKRRNDIMVIFVGQNGGYADDNELISQIKAMVDYNTATRKEYIVLGLTSGSASHRAPLEKAMIQAFGRRYINLRDYLSTYGMADIGLTPTQNDLSAMANGSVPPSMLVDTVHHTDATRQLIGKLVYERMVELDIL